MGWAASYLVSGLVHTGSGPLTQQVIRVPQVIDGTLHLLLPAGRPPSAQKKNILGSRIPPLTWGGRWWPDK